MITLPVAALPAAAILATSFLSGIFGMAGGMILMGIVLSLLPVASAMVLHGVTQLASNGARAFLWRSHIAWRIVAYYAAGAVLVALALAAVRVVPSTPVALIMLGLTPVVALVLPDRIAPDVARLPGGMACGAVCTALQLTAGVSGPIFDALFVRSHLDRKRQVATKAAVQALGHVLKVVYFGQLVAGGAEQIAPAVLVAAVVLATVGTQLSRRVLEAMSDIQFVVWSRRLIVAIAAVFLVQGLVLQFYAPLAALAAALTPMS
jgi:uncharacterized protein